MCIQVTTFVNGLFETRSELGAFKIQLRDFLVQSKEFSAQVPNFWFLWNLLIPDGRYVFSVFVFKFKFV